MPFAVVVPFAIATGRLGSLTIVVAGIIGALALIWWFRRHSARQVKAALAMTDLSVKVAVVIGCLSGPDAERASRSINVLVRNKIHAVPAVMSVRAGLLRFDKVRNWNVGHRAWALEVALRKLTTVDIVAPQTKLFGSGIRIGLRPDGELDLDLDCPEAEAHALAARLRSEIATA